MNDFEKACDQNFTGETMQENAIDFLRNAKTATVNFCQGRYVSKIRKLAEQFPDECEIVSDKDDVVVAHIPVKWIQITRREITMTDEKRELLSKRAREIFHTSIESE